MKLEVGKSYTTRDGEKVTIYETTASNTFHYRGDNHETYKHNGCAYDYQEHSKDLISEWVEPVKYKEGDNILIKLSSQSANRLNAFPVESKSSLTVYHEDIISHTPAPKPEFDWSKVKAGMAFHHSYADNPKSLYFYVGKSINSKETVICYRKSENDYGNFCPQYLTRSPENDIEV